METSQVGKIGGANMEIKKSYAVAITGVLLNTIYVAYDLLKYNPAKVWEHFFYASVEHIFIILLIPLFILMGYLVSKLEREIAQRKQAEKKLEKDSRELEESNRLKDMFIDILRHDLLNPAGVAKNMAELSLKSEADPEKKEALHIIFDTNKRIIELVENASILAKLESGEKLELKEADLGTILRNAAKEMESFADQRKVEIKTEADGEFKALTNPLIYDAFSNLISNAIKYGPEDSEVVAKIEEDGPSWKISVADNGPGVPDEHKEAIFET